MTGTPNLEGIAGLLAAIEYLADLGRECSPQADRRAALATAFAEISAYERELCRQLIAGLAELPSVRMWGITDPARFDQRVPTVSITHAKRTATELSAYLGERGISTWHGDFYAPELIRALGLEPEGMVRLGLLHYNTSADVGRLLAALRELE